MIRSRLFTATSIVLTGLSFAAICHAAPSTQPAVAAAPATQPMMATAPTTAPSADSAEGILAAFDGAKMPKFDATKQGDKAYIDEFRKQYTEFMQLRAETATKLVEKYPDNPRAGEMLLIEVQTQMATGSSGPSAAVKTIEEFLAAHPATPSKTNLLYQKAAIAARSKMPYDRKVTAIADFDAASPKDKRTPDLKAMAISQLSGEKKNTETTKFLAENAGTPAAKRIEGGIRRADGVGKTFDLAFDEAVTGKHIDLQKDLKNKIVVIDFWATWCGPCVAEMPNNIKLYDEFKTQGVEFIGVSLDQSEEMGGKKKLLAYVEKNKITWPQYYQGNFWDSDFSTSWGIVSIPAVFVIDADGKVYSTEARGQLEKILPELIKKRGATAAAQ